MSKKLEQVNQFVSSMLSPITILSGNNLAMIDQTLSIINKNYFKEQGRVVPINKVIPKTRLNKGLDVSTTALNELLKNITTERHSKIIQSAIVLTEIEETIVIKDLETLVHHTLLQDVLFCLFVAAIKNECRLIITTQSRDVIEASINCLVNLNDTNFQYHRLYSKDYRIETFSYQQVKDAVLEGRDIR